MTQMTIPAPTALPQTDSPPTLSVRARQGVATWLHGTPGRLRVLLVLAVVVCVLFGAGFAQIFSSADDSLQRARANTAQLVRVQTIHTSLVSAHADATKAFLQGGLEPAQLRTRFTASIDTASRLIAEAARAQPADAKALGALNTTLVTYRGLIEQARTNNRQGLPLGAQYLKDADTLLVTEALPVLNALVTAGEQRLRTEFDRSNQGLPWLIAAGFATLLVLVGVSLWVAVRSHRYVNVPLAGAAVVVLVALLLGWGLLWAAASQASGVRTSSYAVTRTMASARITGYDAQSSENLTLIARGSGATYEDAWQDSARTTRQALAAAQRNGVASDAGPQQWQDYEQSHRQVRRLDDSGNWDQAVARALGSSSSSFAAFDQASQRTLSKASTTAQQDLRDAAGGLSLLGWLGLPIGVATALLAWWGLAQRLEEYR